jgi:hypothetical protein
VAEVAEAAGVPEERIERYAYPVLLERGRIAELARSAHPIREDGPDVRTLAEIVTATFVLRGQDYEQSEWDAARGEDNKWVVTLSWSVGHSDITARWGYHPGSHGGTVTALDEHAIDLVDGQRVRPPRRVGPVVDFGKPDPDYDHLDAEPAGPPAPPAARAVGLERATPRQTDAGRRATKTTTGPGARSGKTANQPGEQPDSQPDRRESARQATAKPAPARETAARQSSTRPATTRQTGPRSAASGPTPATDTDSANTQNNTGNDVGNEAAKRPSTRKSKPVMPSWEDVLLGVKSQRT